MIKAFCEYDLDVILYRKCSCNCTRYLGKSIETSRRCASERSFARLRHLSTTPRLAPSFQISTTSSFRCMNQFLFNRSSGNLRPQAFARIQTTQLIHSVQPAPRVRFDGGERAAEVEEAGLPAEVPKIWAHQAGVNALALDIEGKLYVAQLSRESFWVLTEHHSLISGGADSSIKLWNVQKNFGTPEKPFRPSGSLAKSDLRSLIMDLAKSTAELPLHLNLASLNSVSIRLTMRPSCLRRTIII